MSLTRKAIKGSAIESPTQDPATHLAVLRQLKEVAEIGQRVRGDPGDSFVRVSELVGLGLARLVNSTLQPYPSSGSTTAPVSSARNILTPASVIGGGNLSADLTLTLAGDQVNPAGNRLYGTNAAGSKGWQTLPDFVRGATWVTGSGALALPTNDVYVQIPRACTLKEVTIVTSGGPGSCTVDILKGTFAGFPSATSICGGVPPQITSGSTYDNTALSGWTTSLAANDILAFRLSATTTFAQIAVSLRMG